MSARRSCIAAVAAMSLVACAGRLDTGSKRPELPTPDRELKLPGQGYFKIYDNGLKLFVVPDAYTRLVQFDVRHEVGSREDPAGKSGLAHFVEHLMFQIRVEGPDSPKLMSDIQQHALSFNAYTSSDETHYMHTGTADELENYMKYTALRIGFDCDAIDEDSFLREREVVRNEHRWRGQAVDAFVYERVLELVFPEGHPYRQASIGDEDLDIASITPEDTCDFIKRYYSASQASVVITGDVDPARVLALANEYLEPLPKVEAPPRDPVPPPTFEHANAQIVAPVKTPTAMILFKTPKRFSKNYAASQAALQTMFLAIAFFTSRDRGSVVERWYPVFLGGKEAPLFGVGIETEKPTQLDRGIDEVLDAISRGFAANVKGKEYKGSYDAARQRARLQVLDNVATILSRSNAYADYLIAHDDDPVFFGAEIAEYDELTAEHAHDVGRKVFARNGAMVVKVVPDGSEDKPKAERADFDYEPNEEENLSVPTDIDPTEAHQPLPIDDIAPPQGESMEYDLENGMRVVLVKSSDLPVMDVQVIIGAGMVDAPDPALAQMAVRAYGPRQDREAANLMTYFDRAGGIFGSNVGPLATTFTSRGISVYLDFIIAGVSEQVVQAEYRTGALENYKLARKKELEKKSATQAAQRDNFMYTQLYGKGHPHVRRVIADADRLRELKLRDLEDYRDQNFRAANSAVIVTGGFDMGLASQYVEAFFGNPVLRDRRSTWLEPKATADRPPPPQPKPGKIRYITEIDDERVQTDVATSYPLAEAYGDHHAALAVMADMLNFQVSAVRQKLGASYGVYARLDLGRPRIVIGGALDSARAGEGFKEIRAAVQRIIDGEDFDRHFAFARRNVLRNMINAQGDPRLLASQLAQAVRNGRSYGYFRDLATKVANLKPAQVKAEIERVLRHERSVTLIQGPARGVQRVLTDNGITGAHVLPKVVHDEDD